MEEEFQRKLTLWKKQYLPKGGRFILIKNMLLNLPIYFVSFCHSQKGELYVRANLEKFPLR